MSMIYQGVHTRYYVLNATLARVRKVIPTVLSKYDQRSPDLALAQSRDAAG